MNPVAVILSTLDRHLRGPAHLRLMGGAALVLGYRETRDTEDVDLLMEQAEVEALAGGASLGEALERTNAELEPGGLYISHIFGPEQQILTPEWKSACRTVAAPFPAAHLSLSVLGPLDLIVSKLARGDDADLADIAHVMRVENVAPGQVRAALDRARVPEILREAFAAARARLQARLARPRGEDDR